MKMIRNIILIASTIFLVSSCDKFLNVNPKGEVFDIDMFTSAEGYEDALYGIYAELGADQHLYNDYMVWIPEVMSINYKSTETALNNLANAQWDGFEAPRLRRSVWSAAYRSINHINNILHHIEKGGDNEFPHTKLYKGEALGLRAMLHFDMLRMFGVPPWATAQDKKRVIPYVTKYSFDITPFNSYDEAIDRIIYDLKLAEDYLTEDKALLPAVRDNITAGFTSCRIIHMNLYAVQALLARVYWYKGDLSNAAVYAKKVIESGKFTMRPRVSFVQSDNGTLDLNETIFGLYSIQSNSKNARAFGFTSTSSPLTIGDDVLVRYNDGSSSTGSDLRVAAWFSGTQPTKLVNNTYIAGINSYTGKSILGVNIIRIPEMYYIMAESLMNTDMQGAIDYYNAVVTTRDLDALTLTNPLTEDILFRERSKEFFGEGFRWFDMKRLGKDIQVSTSVLLPGDRISTYTIPLPISEEENRDEQ